MAYAVGRIPDQSRFMMTLLLHFHSTQGLEAKKSLSQPNPQVPRMY